MPIAPLIGYPELLTGGEDGAASQSPQPPVNNSDAPDETKHCLENLATFAHGFHGQAAHPGRRMFAAKRSTFIRRLSPPGGGCVAKTNSQKFSRVLLPDELL